MKVKDVIVSALNILGRAELAAAVTGGATLDAEGTETVNTLLYCFNAVEDELARKYVPLVYRETMTSPVGEYFFMSFVKTPVRIKKVYVDGKEVDYKLYPQYIQVDSKKIDIEYEYSPNRKKLDGNSDYASGVSEHLIALGAAAEYCLINGEVEAADLWEAKYRREVDTVQQKLPVCANIPPRRWV